MYSVLMSPLRVRCSHIISCLWKYRGRGKVGRVVKQMGQGGESSLSSELTWDRTGAEDISNLYQESAVLQRSVLSAILIAGINR